MAEADVKNLTTEKISVTKNISEINRSIDDDNGDRQEIITFKKISKDYKLMECNKYKRGVLDERNVNIHVFENICGCQANKNTKSDSKFDNNDGNNAKFINNDSLTKWYVDLNIKLKDDDNKHDEYNINNCENGHHNDCNSLNIERHNWHSDEEINSSRTSYNTSKTDLFPLNLSNQIRAVSSPSLTENPLDTNNVDTKKNIKNYIKPAPTPLSTKTISSNNYQVAADENNYCHPVTNNHNQNYAGVLQKFKKTFTQFKSTTPTPSTVSTYGGGSGKLISSSSTTLQYYNNNNNNITTGTTVSISVPVSDFDSAKYKFGQLVWRTSKERRKTKYNRRDKCNSGDSGIQIELENDENYLPSSSEGQQENFMEIISSSSLDSSNNVRVRRVNSAKATTNSMKTSCSSAKTKALRKIENNDNTRMTATPLPTRSLSQPSGLDRIARADLDESDTDSISSHPDLYEGNRSVYAEVLFPFTPAGPQELALEKGTLIEVLRKDGPWWYGKIKHDEIIEKIIKTKQGWFPKDFVRIIPPFYDGITTEILHTTTKNLIKNEPSSKNHCQKPSSSPSLSLSSSISKSSQLYTNNTLEFKKCDTRLNNSSSSSNNNNNNSSSSSSSTTTILSVPAKVILSQTSSLSSSSSTASSSSSSTSSSSSVTSQPNICNNQQQQQQQQQINNSNNSENYRNNAIKELLETEINYVKLLSSLCLGYLKELRKRIDIFSTESLNLIFSNIENVWNFQQTFLNSLRKGIETEKIAQVFLDHQSGFLVYSTYCNSYPRALMELESYSNSKEAKCVLENCRIAENLPELPLSAHLLAPIQRICRYPLHLAELVKHTQTRQEILQSSKSQQQSSSQHNDMLDCKETLEIALGAMKKVTETVNEGKRHSEHLTRFQASFENFQGPPIAFHSTRFFMQTDATRVSPNLWNNTYTLFLFDHQLIYCKKDILKRNHYIYKGRIFLDNCRILNLPDGKLFGVTLKNALRIFCQTRNKWFDFCFRSANRKMKFLNTLAIERQFCGSNLFVSELAGEENDENLSDREYHSDCDLGSITATTTKNFENFYNLKENINDIGKYNSSYIKHLKQQSIYTNSSDTNLPKKSRKLIESLNNGSSSSSSCNGCGGIVVVGGGGGSGGNGVYECSTSSLGRRRIGNWFRKSKSTNSTPTHSPTHHQSTTSIMIAAATAASVSASAMTVNNSDSSSQSSPALGGYKSLTALTTTGNKTEIKDTFSSS